MAAVLLRQLSPGDERAFFEIAATLIPLLLFGGVFVERVRPPQEKRGALHLLATMSILLFGIFALFAEAAAIRSVVAGDAEKPTRIFVAFVLVAGMTLVVMAIATPWMTALANAEPGMRRWLAPVTRLLLVACGIGAFIVLVDGTDVAIEKTVYSKKAWN
jgi:uncharacterized protein YhhL (DUF1145 family)